MSTEESSVSAPIASSLAIRDILCLTDLSPRSETALYPVLVA